MLMGRLKNSRIAVLVATLLVGFVLFLFTFEFWVSPTINWIIESFVDLTVCQDNHPEPFDNAACGTQIEKYRFIDSAISWDSNFLC